MGDFVEGFGKVKQYGVNLLYVSYVQQSSNVMMGCDELCLTWSFGSKAVLWVCKDVVDIKVIHDVFVYYVFKNFANDRCETNGAIVSRVCPVACLKKGGNICTKPVVE